MSNSKKKNKQSFKSPNEINIIETIQKWRIEQTEKDQKEYKTKLDLLEKLNLYLENFYRVHRQFTNTSTISQLNESASFEKQCKLQVMENSTIIVYYYELQDGIKAVRENIFTDKLDNKNIDQISNLIRNKLGQ